MYNFDPYSVLLSIATNIPVLLMTAFVLQGHRYKSRSQMHGVIHCFYLLSLNVNVYERLYYCTVIKEDHNAEKTFSVTTFGFEVKIMDKCCVCGSEKRTPV